MASERNKQKSSSELLVLRVSEALGKDVGRGLARLDPKDLDQIGAEVGDILSV